MAVQQNILLDSEIRDWVLLPIVFILLCVGVLRHYLTLATKSKPKTQNVTSAAEQQLANYTRLILANASFIPYDGLKQRSDRLGQRLSAPVENNQLAAAMDPSMMGDMMKRQVMMIVPQMVMMSVITALFQGFVVAKFPFSLSAKFKGMTQRGVDIDDLDGSYATSLSLYFLITFGLQGLLQLVLGQNEGDESQMMQQQMSNPTGQPAQQDMNKVYKALGEELQFAQDTHSYAFENATQLLLQGK